MRAADREPGRREVVSLCIYRPAGTQQQHQREVRESERKVHSVADALWSLSGSSPASQLTFTS